MEMNVKESGDITIIELSGDVDSQSSPEVKSRIRTLISDGRSKLVVDLEKVRYMDSAGLGLLLSGLKAARKESSDLKLAAIQKRQVQSIFRLTNLNKVFEIFENQEDAVVAFR